MQTQLLPKALLYLEPPTGTIRRQTFMTFAELRLNFYSELDSRREELESLVESGKELKLDWRKSIENFTEDEEAFLKGLTSPYKQSKSSPEDMARRRDIVSHYVCRMACCSDTNLRAKFCDYESKILRMRISKLQPRELINLIKVIENKLGCKGEIRQVDEHELRQKQEQIYGALRYKPIRSEWNPLVWKMPMRLCGFLLDRRECYIEGGYLYVDTTLLEKIVTKMYYRYLQEGLKSLETVIRGILDQDNSNQYRTFIESAPSLINKVTAMPDDLKEVINLNNLPFFAKQSFPPCMLNLYNHITKDKHLKHGGRLQLLLFLKGCGLTMEDNGKFWRAHYKKGVAESDQKQLQYTVKHSYGAEGKKTNYSPYTCHKIINSKVGSGEHHGCPFRHFGTEELRSFLINNYKISADDAHQVVGRVDGKHFELACKMLFRKIHNDPREKFEEIAITKVGGNPNKYYFASRKYLEELNDKNNDKPEPKKPTSAIKEPVVTQPS